MDAELFKEMRHRLKLSQTDLARMLGVHPVTVNKWEKGVTNISRVVQLAMMALIYMDEQAAEAERRRQPREATGDE